MIKQSCRHLKDFTVDVLAVGPNTGLPPWLMLCEDCSATVLEALKAFAIASAGPREVTLADGTKHLQTRSGKSGGAVNWARARRVIEDITKL